MSSFVPIHNRFSKKLNIRKAVGPDHNSPSTIKHCTDHLAPIFTDLINEYLYLCIVTACFKTSTIILIPKKTKITDLNDYRPVALTSVLMKSFECLILCSAPSLAVHLQSQPGLCIMPSTWVSITFTNIWTLLGLMQGFCLWTHSRTAGKQAGPLQPEYVTGLQTFSQTGSSMGGWKVTCLAP